MDKRWQELGDLLVNYSMKVQPGEKVMIAMIELESYDLMYAIFESVIKAGGYPQVQFLSEELNRLVLKHGTDEQILWEPELEAFGMEWADVYFGLRGAHNLNVNWDIPADKLAMLRTSMGKISTARWDKTRWCILRVPNAALAEQAKVDEQTITDMWFNACLLDWANVSQLWQQWAEKLNMGKHVRVIADGTDLSFSVEGRTWSAANGISNMPDGEIATSPVESSVNGHISFNYPGVLGGRLVDNIYLEWKDGELITASSTSNQDFLKTVLATDAGSSKIGEFAIGTNEKVTHFCNDILIDEKIGGTMHIALGRAYPRTGGTNQSAIHWDIIKDMHQNAKIYLDDRLIYQDGKVLL